MSSNPEHKIVWTPQKGLQRLLLSCPVQDIMFGGARGGGKTDGLIGEWLSHADRHGRYARGLFIRRSLPELVACSCPRKRHGWMPLWTN
jgi:hypothetical protein